MMSATHIAIGISTAMVITQPHTVPGFITSIVGGAAGGIVSDIDSRSNSYFRDALNGRLAVLVIIAASLLVDWVTSSGMVAALLNPEHLVSVILGLGIVGVLLLVGYFQKHRGFTHSFLAMFLFTLGVCFIYGDLIIPFAFGFLSHLMLDILNKSPIRIFFPFRKGICLKLCYANKVANQICLYAGIATIVYFFIRPILSH